MGPRGWLLSKILHVIISEIISNYVKMQLVSKVKVLTVAKYAFTTVGAALRDVGLLNLR